MRVRRGPGPWERDQDWEFWKRISDYLTLVEKKETSYETS